MGRPRKVTVTNKTEDKESVASQAAEARADLKKEALKEKEAIKEAKHADKQGEFFNKNVRYKFKDGISCTVMYNKSSEIIDRIMN